MRYDCIIIGGGLSGLTAGIKCAGEGLRTAVFSGGMNSLHFSSGSIDLLGYTPNHKIVNAPFEQLDILRKKNPEHPYSKIPVKIIKESIEFLKDELAFENLNLNHNNKLNHLRITALGILKPTYLSQSSIYVDDFSNLYRNISSIAIINFEGFRDFYPELAAQQLKKNALFNNVKIITGHINLPFLSKKDSDILNSSSIDISRKFDTEKYIEGIAGEIKKASMGADIVCLPAFLGLNKYNNRLKLSELLNIKIIEIPSLPPSIPGIRIDNALKSRFSSLGGELIAGDKVTGGEIINGKLNFINTVNYGDTRHYSEYFILSTGSFLSGGLSSGFNTMDEPLFKLQIKSKTERNKWYSKDFFDSASHPFLSFGVLTGKKLNPYNKDGTCIENLYCTGSILSGYDPVKEGSGGGVAVSTAYYAALNIIRGIRK